MLPDVLDENSFILRDYSSFILNLANKLPNLTAKWTDLSYSEPDSIFLSNIAYVNDLLSYTIDFKYEMTSVKYTESFAFMDTIILLTGGSVPYYREKYYINFINNSKSYSYFIDRNTYYYDSTESYFLSTFKDFLVLPSSTAKVPVIPGAPYSENLDSVRKSTLLSENLINKSSVLDISTGTILDVTTDSCESNFNYLINRKNKTFIINSNGNDLLFLNPSFKDSKFNFINFSLEDSNKLVDNAFLITNNFLQGTFGKEREGTPITDINDYKVSYLESLSRIKTNINENVFIENKVSFQEKHKEDDIEKISLVFYNDSSSFISRSYVAYTEGYIELVGYLIEGLSFSATCQYYKNDDETKKLYYLNTVNQKITSSQNSIVFVFDLPANCTIKANSVIIEVAYLNHDKKYLTDYDSKIIVPHGLTTHKDFKYLLKSDKSVTDFPFYVGRSVVYMENGKRVCEIFLLTQEESLIKILGRDYITTPRALNIFTFEIAENTTEITIFNNSKEPLYHIEVGSFITLDSNVLFSEKTHNLIFYNDSYIYTFSKELLEKTIEINLNNQCSYTYRVSMEDVQKVYINGAYQNINLFRIPINQEFLNHFSVPENIYISYDGHIYSGSYNHNYSYSNYYNALVCSELVQNTIDLYSLENRFTKVRKHFLEKIDAQIFLIPTDISNEEIQEAIEESLFDYFKNILIGEKVTLSNILSRIIHSSSYIAYVLINYPKQDIMIEQDEVAVLKKVNLSFRNSDVIQF